MIFGGRKQSFWTWGCLNWQGQIFYFNWSLTLKTKSCLPFKVLQYSNWFKVRSYFFKPNIQMSQMKYFFSAPILFLAQVINWNFSHNFNVMEMFLLDLRQDLMRKIIFLRWELSPLLCRSANTWDKNRRKSWYWGHWKPNKQI